MEAHFKVCRHCSAILDGTKNVVKLIGDDAEFEVPANFGNRLYQKLDAKLGKQWDLPIRRSSWNQYPPWNCSHKWGLKGHGFSRAA
jgi:hypothetical protein